MKIVFCLPGTNFSGQFLECWSALLGYCLSNGITPILSRKYSCNIYYVRAMCLGADVMRGKNQKPFDGKLVYDYIMWIDSDMVFRPEHLTQLLNRQVDIVSGVYLMANGKELATVKDWDEEHFRKHGHFQFMKMEEIRGKEGLIEVAYTGMGFTLVKKGVFESMEYPWFRPIEKKIGNMIDVTMEDVAFCLQANERGYKILIDPKVKVGHEKSVVF